MKFLMPLILAVAGVGAGAGAGVVLRPDAGAADTHAAADEHGAADADAAPGDDAGGDHGEASPADHNGDGRGLGSAEYVTLGDQFIVPILEASRVRSLVVLSVDLEVASGHSESVYRVEPKLRDSFLTVLFDHANAGGFEGRFTSSGSMEILRRALREAGQKAVGQDVLTDVLITNIVRQDA